MATGSSGSGSNAVGFGQARYAVMGLAKVVFLGLSQLSVAAAAPIPLTLLGFDTTKKHDEPEDEGSIWLNLGIAMVLVLLGGAFAGLTIALMGQDGIYLQVMETSGEGSEKKHAARVHNLLKRGKHWVLVTLLLSNVIVNETLPIILDRALGGGVGAVVGSTVLIVIFGEVIPQSICVRYGLQIGAFMAPPVLGLMYLMAPVAWPTAKLLDWMLGEDHGQVYKKSGLKTLVNLHKTLGTSPSDRLNEDEVAIISAVLDLKAKPIGDIMTPMEDVFTMSADTKLDEKTMDVILSAGYSRIPIYEPSNHNNFIGMLLVKILITYDPEDGKKVSEFALATLPETRPETSCLDIVNFFQEGKSHMVLVSEFPGENYGAIGVVTLEDVIEELIGEEIVDETDVFIDVHKAIRRLAPAPKIRAAKGQVVENSSVVLSPENGDLMHFEDEARKDDAESARPDTLLKRVSMSEATRDESPSQKATFMRRSSTGEHGFVNVRSTTADMREHLKHLGPSNLASRPRTTRFNTVKIKPARELASPGINTPSNPMSKITEGETERRPQSIGPGSIIEEPYTDNPGGGEGAGLLSNAGMAASDGVQALHQGYGTVERPRTSGSNHSRPKTANGAASKNLDGSGRSPNAGNSSSTRGRKLHENGDDSGDDEISSLRSPSQSPPARKRGAARSGSITENIIESHGGIRKVVLETNQPAEEEDDDSSEAIGGNSRAAKSTNSLLAGFRDGIMGRDSTENSGNGSSSSPDGDYKIIDETVTDVKKKQKKKKKAKGGKAKKNINTGYMFGQ